MGAKLPTTNTGILTTILSSQGQLPSQATTSTGIIGQLLNSGNAYIDQIETLALESACTAPARLPLDYMKKFSLNYARYFCQLKTANSFISMITPINLGSLRVTNL